MSEVKSNLIIGGERVKRKKIYICAPWRGKTETERMENKARTVKYWRRLYDLGYHPIAPQLLYGWLLNDDDPQERRDGLDAGLEDLQRCDEIWVFGDQITEGMRGEIREAVDRGIPIKYSKQLDKENEKTARELALTRRQGKNP